MNTPDFDSMDMSQLQLKRDQHWHMAALARMDRDHQDELWHVNMAKAYSKAIAKRLEADAIGEKEMNLPNFDMMTMAELRRKRDKHWESAALARRDRDHPGELWHMDIVKEYVKEILRRLKADAPAATGSTRLSGALNDVLLELKRLDPKNTTPRDALVRACAAILGEIERMDRLT